MSFERRQLVPVFWMEPSKTIVGTNFCQFGVRGVFECFPCPSFPWFFCFAKEKPRINQGFCPLPNPLKPWKSRENAQITKEIPCLKLTKEFQKTKERKDRVGSSQTWLFQTWLFAIFTRKRSFALFCALLHSFALPVLDCLDFLG